MASSASGWLARILASGDHDGDRSLVVRPRLDARELPGRSRGQYLEEVAVEQHLGWEDSNSEMSLYKRLGRTPWFSRMFSYQRLFALPRG